MKLFWKFLLRKNLPGNVLETLKYAVFGLGDSSYAKFNYPAKKLFRRLSQLGAHAACPRGDGDDQHFLGLDGGLIPWLKLLLEALSQQFPVPASMTPLDESVCPDPSFRLVETTRPSTPDDQVNLGLFQLIENRRITHPSHFQDIRHISFRPKEHMPEFSPGDIASFTPQNLPEDVDSFIELMGWQAFSDVFFRLEAISKAKAVPSFFCTPKTLREIVSKYVDLRGTPRRTLVEYLYYFSSDELEKEKFHEWLTTADGQEDMAAYLHRPRRTLLEVLADFRSYKVPLDYLLDAFAPIQARSFSIASSPKNECLDLMVGIVEYRTRLVQPRLGLATQFIKHMLTVPDAPLIRITVSRGTMALPLSDAPIIMVGPGLGIAPFRSFIQARAHSNIAQNYLISGCRFKEMDEHYADEWKKYVDEGLLWYRVAASRDQNTKRYVQHIIQENATLLWDLIHNNGAHVYVCGSSGSMPKEVMEAFQQIACDMLNVESGAQYVDSLVNQNRYQQETWS
ncbi:NAPDH-dependent diflavin reductase, variant 2 [Entomophthora muscae]|nr:NAPDH-dependent diflavin reductase, variant 2 [Entomophthora muscae]